MRACGWLLATLLAAVPAASATPSPTPGAAADFRQRLPQDEIIYFLLPDRFENGDASNDRGGLDGGREVTGFDPTDTGFYHGGDLKGVLERLDYIQALGATAVWLGPVFKNKTVQGRAGNQSAGYHGYWITDFTRIDPHFGTQDDFKALVEAAHARGLKIYLDIVVNHTADVIAYRECPASACAYRSRADYPYVRRGGPAGDPINSGFMGDAGAYQTDANFAKLTRADYAYTPFVPPDQAHAKAPDWLNELIYYHNRGNSTFHGESSTQGDFGGLDDLMTEHPRVVRGFIEIYGDWIDGYGIDGYRIDTARHVNPEFWQAFVPAMRARASAKGIPNFHMFGEVATSVFDPGLLARHTRVDGLPAVLDFDFAVVVRDTVAGTAGTDRLAELFADDALYEGGATAALQLPTFISNHDDFGRFAARVRHAFPQAAEDEVLRRVTLANAMLLTLRGVPVIYYGDEQGFAAPGNDRSVREDMFAGRTAAYNAVRRLGAMPADSGFDTTHPLYRRIAELAQIRRNHLALRRGLQTTRLSATEPGPLAVSRFDPATGAEIVIVFNTATHPIDVQIEVDPASATFAAVHGRCAAAPTAPGSYAVHVAPLDYLICKAGTPQ